MRGADSLRQPDRLSDVRNGAGLPTLQDSMGKRRVEAHDRNPVLLHQCLQKSFVVGLAVGIADDFHAIQPQLPGEPKAERDSPGVGIEGS